MAGQFEALPVDRSQSRPVIGLVGEIYLRFNTYSNQDIIRQVENAGGEVVIASMMEWFYFINWWVKVYTKSFGMYLGFFAISIAFNCNPDYHIMIKCCVREQPRADLSR